MENEDSNPLGLPSGIMALLVAQKAQYSAYIVSIGLRAWIIDWAEQEYAKGNTSVCSKEDFELLQEYKNRDSFAEGYKVGQSTEGKTQQVACIITDIRAENEARAKDKVTA